MKNLLPALVVLGLASAANAQTKQPVEVGLGLGYAGGLTVEGTAHAPGVLKNVGARADVSYTNLSNPLKNVKQGNTASGSNIVIGLGATYPVMNDASGLDAYVHGGVRYSIANATETNADKKNAFHSKQGFGLGGGVQVSYPVTNAIKATADLGVDHIFPSAINITEFGGTQKKIEPQNVSAYQEEQFYSAGTNFKFRVGVKTTF